MNRMRSKGVDNAFILYSLTIFFSAHCYGEEVDELLRRGRIAELRWKQYHRANSSIFDVATCAFHVQAVKNHSSEEWFEYGLCKMLVYNDFKGARKAFDQALNIDTKDERIKTAYSKLLYQMENVAIRFL